MSNSDVPAVAPAERDAGLMAHGAALGGVAFELLTGVPFFGLAGALAAWLATRSRGDFADDQGREAVRFQVFLGLWAIVITVLSVLLLGAGAFMAGATAGASAAAGAGSAFLLIAVAGFVITVAGGVFPILALIKVNKSQRYRYPFTFSPRRGK